MDPLEFSHWKIIKDSYRPLVEEDFDNGITQCLCLVKLKETDEELLQLCGVKEFDSECHKLGSNIRILIYDYPTDSWIDENSLTIGKYEAFYAWYPLEDLVGFLDKGYIPALSWEFGYTLSKLAVPSLQHWIDHGVSYTYDLSMDEWKGVLTKIKDAFQTIMIDLDSGLDIIDTQERDRIIKEHKQKIKEAFSLMAEYYLDLWD